MPRHSTRFLATLLALLGTLALQSCAGVFGSKPAEVTTVSEPPGADVADVPSPSMGPSPTAFVSSAPGEIVSEAARSNRRTVVSTMLRLGTVNAVEQGPPGILRTAIGETFHTSNIREYHYTKLASAYHTWTAEEEGTLVIELWERGQKIGEYSDGAFLMGPGYSTPLDCAGPGAAGICGAIAPVGRDPLTPAPAPGTSEPTPVTPPPSPIPVGSAEARGAPAADEPDVPRGHRGFHFGFGLGSGSAALSCGACDFSRETALSGYLSLSSSIAENLLLGIESTGWTHELETGSSAQVYSLMAVLTGYMNESSGLFLRTGAGLVGYREDSEFGDVRGNGFGFSGRLGYELGSGSLTVIPYVGYMGTFGYPTFTLEDADYAELAISNIQLGLALGIQ